MDDLKVNNIESSEILNSPGHPSDDAIVMGSSSHEEPFQFPARYLKKSNVNLKLNHVNRNLNERSENYFEDNNGARPKYQNRPKPNHDSNKVLIIKPLNDNRFSDELLKSSKKRVQILKESAFKECIEKDMIIEIRVNLKKRHFYQAGNISAYAK